MHKRHFSLPFLLAAMAVSVANASDQIPATQPTRPVVLTHATIHTVSGDVLQDASLLIVDGKIVAVGIVEIPSSALARDCAGQHIYPGLIDGSDSLGLIEIDAVRATRDTAEAGLVNPNVRAQISVNPDSELIPTTRSNGVLISHVMPGGGLLSGTSAIMMLDGWTWEEMTLVARAGVVMNWPNMSIARSYETPEEDKKQLETRDGILRQIDRAFDDARAYALSAAASSATTRSGNFDARWESMLPILDRSLPLYIRADEMGQINAAVAFARRQNVRCVIVGGRDADRCADLLKSMDVPVFITGTQRLPGNADDGYDAVFALPAKLKAAGVRFAITSNGWASQIRNLPYQAASAIAFDLSRDDAVKSITLWPAQILGIDARVGSIEVGKDATLFLTDGDVLEITSNVQCAFVQGREIDLNDRHKMLRDKYERRIAASTQPKSK